MEKSEHKAGKLMVLLEVGRRLASNMDLDSLLDLIIKYATEVMKADRSSLFLVDKKTGELWSKIAQGADEIRFPIGKGIAGHVAETGEIINIPDAYSDPRFNPEVDRQTGYRTKTILCVPLKNNDGEIVGVIQVLNKKGEKSAVFEREDEEILLALAGQAAVAITNAIYHKEVLAKQKLERDLQIARTVQESFLPSSPPRVPGYQFEAYYKAAQEVGGDFYDFIPLSEDQVGLIMGDVSGKGVPAALFMARLMSDFRFISLTEEEPKDILARVNDLLAGRSQRGMFVTLGFVILDTLKKRITFSSAGHLPPILVKAGGSVHRLEVEKGIPLGIAGGREFGQDGVPFEEGDTLLLYTDGLMEARNAKGREFGLKRIEKIVSQNADSTAKRIKSRLLKEINSFVTDTPQHDDLTFILAKANRSGATSKRKKAPSGKRPGVGRAGENISLSVPSDPGYLALVRKNVETFLGGLGFTESQRRKIVLAVDEAASNVIKHGYKGNTEKRIDFMMEASKGKLTIKIRDYGETPDIEKIKPRRLDDIKPGGLGTHFLNEVMDSVDYDTGLGVGTLLTLTKKLPRREAGS